MLLCTSQRFIVTTSPSLSIKPFSLAAREFNKVLRTCFLSSSSIFHSLNSKLELLLFTLIGPLMGCCSCRVEHCSEFAGRPVSCATMGEAALICTKLASNLLHMEIMSMTCSDCRLHRPQLRTASQLASTVFWQRSISSTSIDVAPERSRGAHTRYTSAVSYVRTISEHEHLWRRAKVASTSSLLLVSANNDGHTGSLVSKSEISAPESDNGPGGGGSE